MGGGGLGGGGRGLQAAAFLFFSGRVGALGKGGVSAVIVLLISLHSEHKS